MSDLSKSENEIYSLRNEKEQKIKDSKYKFSKNKMNILLKK